MTDFKELESFETQIEMLETSMAGAIGMAAGFEAEMRRIRSTFAATGQDVRTLERGMSRGLRRAFDGVVLDGMKLSDALKDVAQSMIGAAYSAAVRPVTDHFGTMLSQGVGALMSGILPFEKGGGFAQGRVMPFARGGVVGGPTHFRMRGGMGLMGEAGPEAIMPLSRAADGSLGVKAQPGGAPINVVMNIQSPDADSFRRSQSQIATQISRALGRAQRNR
ncbi:phage tail tape measure protein [Lutimaribacter sp. EGI FJ00015]|uniref:Phage tail tape measure protein n=1 Tax=Lutimaribacter degradans TaxID=2945989 RepID=A0ACC5ZU15_9RHOB|nr:phage tail tape measure protein [Lutimaribacter sp. EGI FJ00013]MCM2561039.1 phage tail tape measure protein [Lutimaribacter sp. EGI FJ00013]MCO0612014.1 phage tail tape measure protein [Lutimaribacter sp. EGI FJ00015]MCO0634866.1 phage tail tape measure protein [Lutimaribacter sp. EGI FJ00014]